MSKKLLLVPFVISVFALSFAQAAAQAKPEVQALIDKGISSAKATQYEEAVKVYGDAIKKAQELGDTFGEADANQKTGKAYYQIGNYIKAKEFYSAAVVLFHKCGSERNEMMAKGDTAQVDSAMGHPQESRETFLELIKYFQDRNDNKGSAYSLLSICFVESSLRLYDAQLAHAKAAVTAYHADEDKAGEGTALNHIGLALRGLRRKDESIKAYQDSAAFAKANDLKSIQATAFANLGSFCRGDGDFQKAIDYYRQAQELYKAINSQGLMADIGINLGIVYCQVGQMRLSVSTLRESADTFRKFGNKPKLATALNNLGVVLDQDKQNKPAEIALKEALSLYQEMGDEDSMDSCYTTLGAIYVREGRYPEAAAMEKKALAIAEKNGEKLAIGICNETLGNIAFYQHDFATALSCFTKSVNIYRELNNRAFLAETLGNVAKAQGKLGRLAQSEASYRESISRLEEVRRELGASSEGKAGFLSQSIGTYHDFISLLVRRGKVAEAFDFTQKTKARSLLDLMEDGNVSVQREMTAAERAKEAELRKKADEINAQMVRLGTQNEVGSKKRFAELKIELQKAEDALSAFMTQLYAKYPGLQDRRSARTATLAEVASHLPPKTALLEYVAADEPLVFVVTSRGGKPTVSCHRLTISMEEIGKDSAEFRRALSNPVLPYQSASRSLFKYLIAPVTKDLTGVSKLIVCPDGALWHISFAALSNGTFLAEKYEISYGYSATTIEAIMRSPKSRRSDGSLLIMANPDFGGAARFGDNPLIAGQRPIEPPSRPIEPPSRPIEPPSRPIEPPSRPIEPPSRPIEPPSRPIEPPSRDLSLGMRSGIVDLPGTQIEANAIANLFPKATVLTRKRAQESAFVKTAGNFRYLHIASHAFFNDASPMLSSIVMAKPSDPSTDGYLTARELFDLKLKADLIVLSACNTARGAEQPGEGIVGLSWALFEAGVPSQVVSQWSVDDRAAAALMTHFYRNLKSGRSKSAALQGASLSLMARFRGNNPKWRHPYYWAPFILIGDNR